ncbi:MAG: hypothetical protein J6I99_05680 [Oscillospiraceae bacterium]|nr:hypothetical protein [Oscillospiraceae bacterium]
MGNMAFFRGGGYRRWLPPEIGSADEAVLVRRCWELLVLDSGGFPVLAHPTLYHMSDDRLEKLVSELKEAGLMGMECIYSTYTPAEIRQMTALAKKYALLPSGGSDFHGNNKPKLDLGCGYGKLCVPDEIMWNIKTALGIR